MGYTAAEMHKPCSSMGTMVEAEPLGTTLGRCLGVRVRQRYVLFTITTYALIPVRDCEPPISR